MKELSNKKLHTYRYLSYWSYVFSTIGIPIALIVFQYDIFKKPSGVQMTAWGIIAVIITLFVCRGHLSKAIEEMETSVLKTILTNTRKLFPWMVCWFLLTFLKTFASEVQFILFWSIVGNFLAMFLDIWHTNILIEYNRRKGNR